MTYPDAEHSSYFSSHWNGEQTATVESSETAFVHRIRQPPHLTRRKEERDSAYTHTHTHTHNHIQSHTARQFRTAISTHYYRLAVNYWSRDCFLFHDSTVIRRLEERCQKQLVKVIQIDSWERCVHCPLSVHSRPHHIQLPFVTFLSRGNCFHPCIMFPPCRISSLIYVNIRGLYIA